MSSTARGSFNALIRSHHITSRKKVTRLKRAAADEGVYALLRSDYSPGIMYVEGPAPGVTAWVAVAQRLRYKDYRLVAGIAEVTRETPVPDSITQSTGLSETTSIKDFAATMEQRGVQAWWRRAMGYIGNEYRL